MKINKKIVALAATVAVLGSASAAMAYGHGGMMGGGMGGYCGGFGPGMMGVNSAWTPEQQQEFLVMRSDFDKQMEPKRQALYAKQLELSALGANPNTKPETVNKLSQEIAAMNGEMREMGRDFQNKLQEKFGNTVPGMRMMGHGGRHGGGRW